MKRLLNQRTRQMTRCSRYALIVALLVPLSPMVVWAHSCGPTELSVKKGGSVEYVLPGPATADFEVIDTGDSMVATVAPNKISGERLGKFDVTGVGDGTTTFEIHWQGPEMQGTCPVSITVSE